MSLITGHMTMNCLEHSRWFRNAQRLRAGCEGPIIWTRHHGCPNAYRGPEGMKRWVALGYDRHADQYVGKFIAARALYRIGPPAPGGAKPQGH
jgi:hypothetical protein